MPVFLTTADAGFEAAFQSLLGQKREEAEDVDAAVAGIIADVRARGDAAVIALTLFAAMVPAFLGLLVVLPVLGHATWHLYRRVVG